METRLTSFLLVVLVLAGFSCTKSGQKEGRNSDAEASEEATNSSQEVLEPENPELMAAYADAKEGWFETISENEKMIASLKSALLAEKVEERGDREKVLVRLEQLNNRQKTKIALFKPNNEENWERFKVMLTNDLNQITQDLKAMKK